MSISVARGRLEGNAQKLDFTSGPLDPFPNAYPALGSARQIQPAPRIRPSGKDFLEKGQRGTLSLLLQLEGISLGGALPVKSKYGRVTAGLSCAWGRGEASGVWVDSSALLPEESLSFTGLVAPSPAFGLAVVAPGRRPCWSRCCCSLPDSSLAQVWNGKRDCKKDAV